jgi:hypothetical protein
MEPIMLKLSTMLFAAAFALSASATAVAGPSVENITVVPVPHTQNFELRSRDMISYRGLYHTSHGLMHVTLKERKLYAQFDGEPKVAMLPVAPKEFHLANGRTRVVFDQVD